MSFFRTATVITVSFSFLFATPDSVDASSWKSVSTRCNASFKIYDRETIPRLAFCMRMWGMHYQKEKISERMRAQDLPSFQRVFREGDLQMRYDAGIILRILGGSVPLNVGPVAGNYNTRRYGGGSGGARSNRPAPFVPDECSPSAQKRAKQLYRKAKPKHRRRQYRGAQVLYGNALKACNADVGANYGMAATSAKLNKRPEANKYLKRLLDMGTEKSMDRLHEARIDLEFENMWEDPDFKTNTGFAAIHLVNSMTASDTEREIGADEIRVIRKRLKMLRHQIAKESDNRRTERIGFPRIWFKPWSKVQAIFFKDVVDHPDTRLIPIDANTSKYDIIIAWSQKIELDEYGEARPAAIARKLDPDNVDKSIRGLEQKQTKALRKPESILNKTNRVLGTPENIGGSVERSINRGERLIKRIPGF